MKNTDMIKEKICHMEWFHAKHTTNDKRKLTLAKVWRTRSQMPLDFVLGIL